MKIRNAIFIIFFMVIPVFSHAADCSVNSNNSQSLFPISVISTMPAKNNPMFSENTQNTLGLYLAQGTGSGTLFKLVDPVMWDFYSMTLFMAQYSQPITIFRLPARQSVHIVQNIAYGTERGLSFTAIGMSWDVALFNWKGWYLGIGIGPYMRDSRDRWVDSRLVFGEKFFIGKKVSDKWNVEFFTQHFSNGNFTDTNAGFNFAGFSANYSF